MTFITQNLFIYLFTHYGKWWSYHSSVNTQIIGRQWVQEQKFHVVVCFHLYFGLSRHVPASFFFSSEHLRVYFLHLHTEHTVCVVLPVSFALSHPVFVYCVWVFQELTVGESSQCSNTLYDNVEPQVWRSVPVDCIHATHFLIKVLVL